MSEEEKLIKEYDSVLLKEIKELFNKTKESYYYAGFPTEEEIKKIRSNKKELREAVKGKLEDLIEYINRGVFW